VRFDHIMPVNDLFRTGPVSTVFFSSCDPHQAVEQQYQIDPVVGDVNPIRFFDLLLQMDGTQLVGMVGFEDYSHCSGIDRVGSSPGRF